MVFRALTTANILSDPPCWCHWDKNINAGRKELPLERLMIFTTSVWLLILSVTASGSSHRLLPATALPPHQRPTAEPLNKPTAAVTALSWQEDQLRGVDVSVQVAARQTGSGKPRQWMSRKTEHGGKSSIIVSETTSRSLLCIVSAGLCKLPLYHLKDQFSHGSGENSQQRLFRNAFLKGTVNTVTVCDRKGAEIWGEEQWVNIRSETRHGLQNQRLLTTSIPGNNNTGTHLTFYTKTSTSVRVVCHAPTWVFTQCCQKGWLASYKWHS